MGFLDWITQPSCAELTALADAVMDPTTVYFAGFNRFQAGIPTASDYPLFLPVPRVALYTASEVLAATKLLTAYYKHGNGVYCLDTGAWEFPAVRARALGAIAAYGGLRGFGIVGEDLQQPVAELLLRVFDDVSASKSSTSDEGQAVYAATQVVTDSKSNDLDPQTWLPLWRWALGGPGSKASIRVRIGAMKALQAVLRRGALSPRQVLAASSMATVLKQLVEQRAPSIASAAERNFFLADATALWGAMQSALIAATAAGGGGAPAPGVPGFVWGRWLGFGVAAAAVTGTAVYVARRV